MSITAADLRALASDLANQSGECAHRAAISRAYYAAFHHCRQWHDSLPAPGSSTGKGGGAHQLLINQLQNPAPEVIDPNRQKSRRAAVNLTALRAQRNIADYDLNLPVPAGDVATHLLAVDNLLTLLT